MDELAGYVDAWSDGCRRLDDLLAGLGDDDWLVPTDCPGWSVQDVVAHLLSIEHCLNTGEQPAGIVPLEGRSLASWWTEAGVAQHRGADADTLRAAWAEAVDERRRHLAADPPTDPDAAPPRTPGGVPWDTGTLLRNRALDVWVHEQDIRRAVGRPGGMDAPAAAIVEQIFLDALPYVVAKRAGAPAGTRVIVQVGDARRDLFVDAGGRAQVVPPADDADVRIDLDREAFTVLGAGRRLPDDLPATAYAQVSGDLELGDAILRGLAVTP